MIAHGQVSSNIQIVFIKNDHLVKSISSNNVLIQMNNDKSNR